MRDSFLKKYWFCFISIIVLLVSVLFVDISNALGSVIVLDDLNTDSTDYEVIKYSNYSVIKITEGGEYTLTQNNLNRVVNANIIVESDEDVTLILDGVNVKAGKHSQTSVFSNAVMGTAAIAVQGDTNCKIILKDDTVNTLTGYTEYDRRNNPVNNSYFHTAAISVENTIVSGDVRLATVIIEGESGNSSTGVLNATGGNQSAAIGANCNRLSGNVVINSGVINAVSGDYGAAIGDGDTTEGNGDLYNEEKGTFVWVVGETNSVAKIEVNGGELWATATKDTPGIGTADNLVKGRHAEVETWTGLQIEVNGGIVVAIGGVQAYNPSSAIGPGSNTFVSSNNIVINKGEGETATQIIAVTRTDSGSYPVSNSGGDAIPVLSADSTASVLNVKFNGSKIARRLDFWSYVDPTYSTDPTSEFPNSLLDRMGNIEVLGLAVLLPEGKYKITEDINNNGADSKDPTLDEGLIVGGTGSITCDEGKNGSISCRYPLELRSPMDVTVNNGETASFDVEVLQQSEGGVLTYQWFVSMDAGSNWFKIEDGLYNIYTLPEALLSDSGNLYRCDVTENYYGEEVVLSSLPAKLTVLRDPEYEMNIDVKLDDSLYLNNESLFELYDSNNNKVRDMTFNDGVLSTVVPANTYRLYVDGKDYGKDFVVTEENNSFEINYYSVNLDLVSDNDDDYVVIDSVEYYDSTSSNQIIYLEGSNIKVSAKPQGESKIAKASVNEQDVTDFISSDYELVVSKKTNIKVEFDYKEYDIKVNVNLNNEIFSNIVAVFELRGESEYSLSNNDGVLSGSVIAGTYSLYRDDELIKDNIVVSENSTEFSVDYYSVDLILDSDNEADSVTIDNACYYDDVVDQIIILGGKEIPIKAIASEDMIVSSYSVNGKIGNVNDLINGLTVVVNEKIDLYVKFSRTQYDFVINALLDGDKYTDINSKYELYIGDSKILDLTNNNGIYTGSVISGTYALYIDGSKTDIEIKVNKDSKTFNVNYYSVNTEIESVNSSDKVLLNGIDTNKVVVLAGEKVNVKAVPAGEMKVISFTVNDISNDVNDVLTGNDLIISEKTNVKVCFDVVKYNIEIESLLDGNSYLDNKDVYDLYLDDNKVISLDNMNGLYTGEVILGNYSLFINDKDSNIDISVSSDSKKIVVKYYSVSLDIDSDNEDDAILINGTKYYDDFSKKIVLLNNSLLDVKALADDERKVVEYKVNNVLKDLNDLNSGYSFEVTETINLYTKFDDITYDVTITNYLDNNVYSDIIGEFKLYDSKNNFIETLVNENGVLSTSLINGSYTLQLDDKEILEFNVNVSNTQFRVDYYSVNLVLNSLTGEDIIEINNSCFKGNTVKNEIVVLSGTKVPIKAVLDNEMYVSEFYVNGSLGIVDDLLKGYSLSVDSKTDIIISLDIVSYDFVINTKLDGETYVSNNLQYSLYDNNGNKVIDLVNNNGKLVGTLSAGEYILYEGNKNIELSFNINSTNREFDVDYYSVNVDLVNNIDNDLVLLDSVEYTDDIEELVLLKGTKIKLSAKADRERTIIKYSVDDVDSNIEDIFNCKEYVVNDTRRFVIEFGYVEYQVGLNINLDGKLFDNVTYKYSLVDNNSNEIKLNGSGGKLTGKVITGEYAIYQDGNDTGKSILVNKDNNMFVIDYYSVSLDIDGNTLDDAVLINEDIYKEDTNMIIVLDGDKVSLEAITSYDKKVINYTINGVDSDINSLMNGYDYIVNSKTDIYVQFKNVEHDIKINLLLDDNVYLDAEGVFTLYDTNGNKVSNLTKKDGVLSTSVESGTYNVYCDGVNINYSILVNDKTKEFDINYYSVLLDIETINVLDHVVINDKAYYEDISDKEMVLLKGESIKLSLNPSSDTEVYNYSINGSDKTVTDDLLVVDGRTLLYVLFGNKRYDSTINVYVDDRLSSLDKVPKFDFIRDGKEYDIDDNFTNGNYEIRLNGSDTGEFIEVNKGVINVYFYNVLLTGDVGTLNINGSGLYLKGTNVKVETSLKNGYKYLGWYSGSSLMDTGLLYDIVDINKRYELKAITEALAPYEPILNPVNSSYEYGSDEEHIVKLEVVPYDGTYVDSYQWYECKDDECLDKVKIEEANLDTYISSEVNVNDYYYYNEVVIIREDNQEKLVTGSIVKMTIVPITPIVTVNDKVVYYTGKDVNLENVLLDRIINGDKLDINYKYYLDEEFTILTNKENSGAIQEGSAPINVGTYYVEVIIDGNKNYNEVAGRAKIIILEQIKEEVMDDENKEEFENPNTWDGLLLVVIALLVGGIVLMKSFIKISKYHI